MPDVIVKDSKIHGKGVFAGRDFKKEEMVMKWKPKRLTKEEVEKLTEKEKGFVCCDKGEYLMMQPPEKYINHSCEANTTIQDSGDVAVREIKKGEEITANYSEDMLPGTKMKCQCGSKKCKGIIKN